MANTKTGYQVIVEGQRLRLQQLPRLASGAVNTVGFYFTGVDTGEWAGLAYTAVFWRNEKEVHHVLTETKHTAAGQAVQYAIVPAEVMAEQGAFYLGLMGTGEDFTITSEAIRLNVFQGAITTPTADPEEPTPDIYAQLMQHYAVSQARVSELIAMRGTSGETVVEMSGDDYVQNGTIRLNGASAVLTFDIDGLTLTGYGEHSTDGCIQPQHAPLFPEGQDIPLHCSFSDLDVSIKKGEDGWSYIKIINKSAENIGIYSATCWGFFPLASMTLAEVLDARVDRAGKVWQTAGDHLRSITAGGVYYKNDFNGDGVVNVDDATHLLFHVNSPDSPDYALSWWSVPDVNGDGVVNGDDATDLLAALENNDPAAFAAVPKTESILDSELNGSSVRPVQNKAISLGVANALKGSESGAAVALTDVSPLEHEVKVQLKNKNLFPPQSYNEKNPTTSAGVTFTYNEDGSVLANGTASGNTAYYVCQGQTWEKQMPLPRGTYTLSGSTKNVRLTLGVRTHETAERVGKSSSAGQPLTFTVDNDTTRVDLVVCVDNGKTADNEIVHPQLEAGSVATAYAPHVADFSEVTLTKHGKNLVDISKMTNSQLTDNGDGTFSIQRTPSSFVSEISHVNIQAGTAIRCSIEIVENNLTAGGFYCRAEYDDGNSEGFSFNKTVTFAKNIVGFSLYLTAGSPIGEKVVFKNFQIELGDTATEYEPFKGAETYQANPDGSVVGVTSLAPTTTLTTNNAGVTIDATYNRDTNKVIERLVSAIISLGGAV